MKRYPIEWWCLMALLTLTLFTWPLVAEPDPPVQPGPDPVPTQPQPDEPMPPPDLPEQPAPEPQAQDDEPMSGVVPGRLAPDFTLKDQNGDNVSLSSYRDRIVVIEWFNPDSEVIQRLYKAGVMNDLAKAWVDQNVVWLRINSTGTGSLSRNKAAAAMLSIDVLLDDHAGAVGHLFDATCTPEMLVIDGKGVIRYRGAIDSNRDGNEEEPINYVKKALQELAAGQEVSMPTTTPYGTPIEYLDAVDR